MCVCGGVNDILLTLKIYIVFCLLLDRIDRETQGIAISF